MFLSASPKCLNNFLNFSFCYPPKINLVILKNNLLSYYFYVLQHKNKAFVQDNK